MLADKRGVCGICPGGCNVVISFDQDNQISEVRADEESRMGALCELGKHSKDIVYSKDRLLYPMRRVGKKGTFDFERISWDAAFEAIVNNFEQTKEKYGAKATAFYTGVGGLELSVSNTFHPKGDELGSSTIGVLSPFGSPHSMGMGAFCYVAYGLIAPRVTMNRTWSDTWADLENSSLILIWGANPATDCPPIDLDRIIYAQQRGARVIAIDPRRCSAAKISNADWIPIRPGTDGALAIGLCHFLIENELYDEDFVENWTVGFNEFAEYAKRFTPEEVERITGIPSATVCHLAREISRSKGVNILSYTGLEYGPSAVQTIRATFILCAIAGQLDIPGAKCFRMNGNSFPINEDDLIPNPESRKGLGSETFPLYMKYRDESHPFFLPDSVLKSDPYKIRSLIILGGSFIASWANANLWKKTLNALEFTVCIDRQLTADCAYADIVLPASTYYEGQSYQTYGSVFKIREKIIDPIGESRFDFLILAELAKRLGYAHLYPQTEDDIIRYALKGSGFTLESVREAGGEVSIETKMMDYKKWEKGALRQDGKTGFDTPSGKFEIASTLLREHGYDATPVYIDPPESPLSASPEVVKKYPLVLSTGERNKVSRNTQFHNIDSLSKKYPEPLVTVNSNDAEKRGITSGDMVTISTLRGAITMRAFVTDDIMEGVVSADHGCGHPLGPEAWQNRNVNELTDLKQYDPISGFPTFKSLLCDISVAENSERKKIINSEKSGDNEVVVKPFVEPERFVYLDYNATTPLAPEVKEIMIEAMDKFGNPSSLHGIGRKARLAIDDARFQVANLINCTAKRIVFTGCATESNNYALKGVMFKRTDGKNHFITTNIEHPATLNTGKWLERHGCKMTCLKVDRTGLIDPQDLRTAMTDKTALVSIMLANNEIGTIQPIRELCEIAHEKGAVFHTDAAQVIGKIPVDVKELNVDMLSIAAHKFYAPKGIGALYIKRGLKLETFMDGGEQEEERRGGTENVIHIVGLGKAAELAQEHIIKTGRIKELRDQLEAGIKELIPGYQFNGNRTYRLPNTLNVTLPELKGESIVLEMDRKGVCFSSGSACSAGQTDPSHVLLAIGLSEEDAHCALRFSISPYTEKEDIEYCLQSLKEVIKESKNIITFTPCR